ncbi:glycosyltransferase [Aliarcobacter skirrowii]|uniref:glycosyltransferase family 2 protein n=1 Tax=Aliarcobacter skirrowii TaxID=28200 RepID=UPI0029B07DD6|nr:glycosyltransferase [Aliarcobacter skirrowii]MDX4026786.1 glycosyltransferase [Aliarcobacter skirrowii]
MKLKIITKLLKLFIIKPWVFFIALSKLTNKPKAVSYLKTQMHLYYSSYKYIDVFDMDSINIEINNFKNKPLISIVMPVYNAPKSYLEKAIDSIEKQFYLNWELCICDDGSTNKETIEYLKSLNHKKIKVIFLEKNSGISVATNKAIELSIGEYIAFMDNDDEITPDALHEVVKVINSSDADFIYSDEDFISLEGKYVNPHFKSDFNPELLLCHNYITHFVVVKKTLGDSVGWLRSQYDGAQDYDFVLRATEVSKQVVHIPKVLYHWRMSETSTSFDSSVKPKALENGRSVVKDTLDRRDIKADVVHGNLPFFYKVNYELIREPLVSIIIPFKDKPEFLKMCIESILNKSTYKNFEIIGISNNSCEHETFEEMSRLKAIDKRVNFYEYNVPFNYSQINNFAVTNYAKGEHVILLNNDIEIISENWIEEMLMYSQKQDVGCVGAKLYYPDGKIQHAGVIMGLGGYAAHSHRFHDKDSKGYFNRLFTVQNLSAVTGACLMIKKKLYLELNGLDEIDFVVAYNDVDFCLRVLKAGYKNIFIPYAEAYHYESISRGDDTKDKEKNKRFDKEKQNLLRRHGDFIKNGDPYYNPNLTLDSEDFSIKRV